MERSSDLLKRQSFVILCLTHGYWRYGCDYISPSYPAFELIVTLVYFYPTMYYAMLGPSNKKADLER